MDFENTQKFSREQIKNFNSPKANFMTGTATSPTSHAVTSVKVTKQGGGGAAAQASGHTSTRVKKQQN